MPMLNLWLKNLSTAMQKAPSGEWKDKPQTGRKYWQKAYLIKDYYHKYTEESENSTIKNQTTQLKKWAKDLKSHVTKEDEQRTKKHMKWCFTSSVTTERQMKQQWGTTDHTPTYLSAWLKSGTLTTLTAGGDAGTELPVTAGWNAKWAATLDDSLAVS